MLGLVGATTPCRAEEPAADARTTEVEAGAMPQHLNNDHAPWREYYVEVSHRYGDRRVIYGSVRETSRFDKNDNQGILGAYHPLGARVTGVLEAGGSTTHEVLPRRWLFGGVETDLGAGWGGQLGLRRTDYDADHVQMATATIDRYFGNFQAGYTLYESRLDGAGATAAHRVQASYYYGDRSRMGIAFVNGREAENLGAPQGIVVSDVRSYALFGRHWLNRSWAVSFELLHLRQGDFYTRQGVRFGLRSLF